MFRRHLELNMEEYGGHVLWGSEVVCWKSHQVAGIGTVLVLLCLRFQLIPFQSISCWFITFIRLQLFLLSMLKENFTLIRDFFLELIFCSVGHKRYRTFLIALSKCGHVQATIPYGGVSLQLRLFLLCTLSRGEWSLLRFGTSRLGDTTPVRIAGRLGGDPRSGLDVLVRK